RRWPGAGSSIPCFPKCCRRTRPPGSSVVAGLKTWTGSFRWVPGRPREVAGPASGTELSRGRAEKGCAERPETPRVEPTAPAAAADCPAHADHVRTKLNKKRHVPQTQRAGDTAQEPEIGRASCRERVEICVGAVSLKKKKRRHNEEGEIIREMKWDMG